YAYGAVRNLVNSNPIPGALVTVGGKTVMTQNPPGDPYYWSGGSYYIYGLATGSYTMVVAHIQYIPYVGSISVPGGAGAENNVNLQPKGAEPVAKISYPPPGAGISGTVSIMGIAYDDDFDGYRLQYSSLTTPTTWYTVTARTEQVLWGVLGAWNTSGLATGAYNLRLTARDLAGYEATDAITVSVTAGVVPPTSIGTLRGQVVLQGRADDSGALVTLGSSPYFTTTAADGIFTITNVAAGTYTATATMSGYLSATRTGIVVEAGSTTTLPPVTLRGGDLNGDGVIDIFDLVLVGINFSVSGPSPWP
ncbi:MAG: carboxypeptidase regulatory-like domain-containing protein, partial [Chloroflexi bacterium]|nr:carboxypeptidase regulatory-like domain-containing protein [Chloroflexota bacterium]